MNRIIPLAALAAPLALAACETVEDLDPIDGDDPVAMTCPDTRNFQAFVNAMPGPNANPTLIVTGEAYLSRGMDAQLRAAGPNAQEPRRYRFELETRPGNRQTGWAELRGEASGVAQGYDEVYVTCDGRVIARVTEVQTAY